MTSRASLTVISHGASLTNGLRSRNYQYTIFKKNRKEGRKVIVRNLVT